MFRISVIIPLYNKGPYISRALDSVLAQSVKDFEIIVVDDGSTDHGAKIVKEYNDPRIRLIQQENRGVSAARNRGVFEAQHELIAFLDADDEWRSFHLSYIHKLTTQFSNAGLYTTAYQTCNYRNKLIQPKYKEIPMKPRSGVIPSYFKSIAYGDPVVCSSSVAIFRNIFLEFGGFQVGERYGEDLDLWARVALKYPIIFCWNASVIYHLEADNRACKSIETQNSHPVVLTLREALKNNQVKNDEIPYVIEYIAKKELQLAYRNLVSGNNKKCITILLNSNTRLFKVEKAKLLIFSIMPKVFFLTINKVQGLIIKKRLLNYCW